MVAPMEQITSAALYQDISAMHADEAPEGVVNTL